MHVNFTVHDHKENIIHSRDFVFSLSLITVQPSVNSSVHRKQPPSTAFPEGCIPYNNTQTIRICNLIMGIQGTLRCK